MNRRSFVTASGAAGLAASAASASSAAEASAAESSNQYIELRYLYLRNSRSNQVGRTREFLEKQHLPMAKRNDFGAVGYFDVYLGPNMPAIVMVTAHDSLADMEVKMARMRADKKWMAGSDQFGSGDDPPFDRSEVWLLRAFDGMPKLEVPSTREGKPPRFFDLRTYEAETYRDVREKIRMFNGEEIGIFRKTGVNPVFFGEAVFGSKLPNLTYLVWYDDMDARTAAWTKFIADPDWKRISTKPEWANNEVVSNITNTHLKPLPFSPIR